MSSPATGSTPNRKTPKQTLKIFGVPLTFNLWNGRNRIPLLILLAPLVLSIASLALARDIELYSYVAGMPLRVIPLLILIGFFLFITVSPIFVGLFIWQDIRVGFENFAETIPTTFLRTINRITSTLTLTLLLGVVLFAVDQSPWIKANIDPIGTSTSDVIATVVFFYTFMLVLELLAIVWPRARDPHYVETMTLCILSSLADQRSPYIDDSIKNFNRFLRWMGWRVAIKSDVKLSSYFFSDSNVRREVGRRLLMAVDQGTPLDFVNVVAEVVDRTPAEIMEPMHLFRLSDQRIQTWILILTLVAIVLLSPILEPGLARLLSFLTTNPPKPQSYPIHYMAIG